ncbi:BPI fold-containing family C protein-like [Spea bombifrons]|uniref:BPI fold-containing family C protein-like n=1 Tax=Spea bombifrons TaxID=233779 RepID=UPI0023491494|nr:BPI fold-containing family C protein-like [Spea bombifrons]
MWRLLFLWSCLFQSGYSSPGVMIRVSQKWLDYVRSEGIEVLRHILMKETLPSINGTTRMFGKVNYSISGVLIEEFEISRVSAVPNPPADVLVTGEEARVKVYGRWNVKHWLINDNGSFTLLLSGVFITARLNTFKDATGRPSVLLSACHSEIKHAKLHLTGGASWFYNLFTVFLERPIRDNVNKKLCPKMDEAVGVLQKELATFQVTSYVDTVTELNYTLINPPHVEKTHIDLDLKGTVHPIGSSKEDPPPKTVITLPEGRGSMMYVGFSEYFFNSLGRNYFLSDVLKMTLTHEQFPHAFWLRTGDYGAIIPKIRDYYPVSQAMILTIRATKVPLVTLTPRNITLEMTGLLQGMVVLPYLITNQLFSFSMAATFIADKVHLSGLNLGVSFAIERLKFFDFKSSVGDIDIAALESSLGHSLQESVLQGINDGLRKGIPMPTLVNISLQESAITVTQGCLLVSMDMYYVPWRDLMDMVPPRQHILVS